MRLIYNYLFLKKEGETVSIGQLIIFGAILIVTLILVTPDIGVIKSIFP